MSSAAEEELEMVLGMFSDECERDPDDPFSLIVHLPFRFELHVNVSSTTYPDESYPQLFVAAGPNAQLVSSFSSALNQAMRDEIPLGMPMLVMLIPIAQRLAEEAKEAKESEEQDSKERLEQLEDAMREEAEALEEMAMDVWVGEPIADRKSKFVAHMARVHSLDEVFEVVNYLRRQRHIACAAHPTIWAYRFTDENGVLHQDYDDDGEHGASVKMMFLLHQLNVDGYVVIVTRWWGGILLGPDRFKHIMEVSRKILLTIPEREAELKAREKGKRKGAAK